MFNKKCAFLLLSMFVSVDSFAAVGDWLFETNTTLESGCVADYLGVTETPDDSKVEMEPVYDWETYNCDPGYYLPELNFFETNGENVGCKPCTKDHYCAGGELAYNDDNENEQGIHNCEAGLVSPEKTASAGGCGKIMHVGLGEEDVLYLTKDRFERTKPALVARIAGNKYYAKTSQTDKTVHSGSGITFKAKINNTVYSIHDNTVSED